MENQYLLKGEQLITQSDGDIITLTNYRLRYSETQFGKAHIISMLLKNISSIEVRYRSNTAYLLGSIVLFVAAVFSLGGGASEAFPFAIIFGVILLVVYFRTRKHVVAIMSNGGKEIHFHTKGMKHDGVLKFINQLEEAIKENHS